MVERNWQALRLEEPPDASTAIRDYVKFIANKSLLEYKLIIQTGGKAGESLWMHVMNLVMTVEQIRPLFQLTDEEMRCVLVALTVHDLNKLPRYGKRANGQEHRFAQASTLENLQCELKHLDGKQDVSTFFPGWERYLNDIKYLVDAQQEKSGQSSQWFQHVRVLDEERLEGPLKYLIKLADVSDNSHSGEYASPGEANIRRKLVAHLNAGLYSMGYTTRYRFISHRIAELRGLFTNIIHNEVIAFLRELFGADACIDLLYHPEGVDYLFAEQLDLSWTPALRQQLARRIARKCALLQGEQLAQFIKAKPSGITVDASVMQSGATIDVIFDLIGNIVSKKHYRLEWCEERNRLVRLDFERALVEQKDASALHIRVQQLLQEQNLVSTDTEQLMRGEMLLAYRNFIKEYRADQLKVLKQDAWTRASRLFEVKQEQDVLYALVDPFRRAYAMARELPAVTIDDMVEIALNDLHELESQARSFQKDKHKVSADTTSDESLDESDTEQTADMTTEYLVDYLERNLEIWDDRPGQSPPAVAFIDTLRRYSDAQRTYAQCCYCGSALRAAEWMKAQVPASLGVQNFSNRLEGGSSRDPKRNVCDVCRTQFILEKLAWSSHTDKQGKELVTFYLHLFPYSYFTKSLLHAWRLSVMRLRNNDHHALWFNTEPYFTRWETAYRDFHIPVEYETSKSDGLGMPVFAEAISNTPVLPLTVGGHHYGQKFLKALETAILLANWFDCRVLLSRLPTPLLNLANEYIDEPPNRQPVALLLENAPQIMNWLVPQNAYTRKGVEGLHKQLGLMHQIAQIFKLDSEEQITLIYDLAAAATGDPLALFAKIDRLIEHTAQRRGGADAIELSRQVAPLLTLLLHEGVPA